MEKLTEEQIGQWIINTQNLLIPIYIQAMDNKKVGKKLRKHFNVEFEDWEKADLDWKIDFLKLNEDWRAMYDNDKERLKVNMMKLNNLRQVYGFFGIKKVLKEMAERGEVL